MSHFVTLVDFYMPEVEENLDQIKITFLCKYC